MGPLIAALLAVTLLLASHFGPDQLSCVETYVDGQSGRLKHVRYIAMAPVWEWEEETPYSRRVHAILGPTPPADWHLQRINRTFGQTCILTTYGGAPWACQTADAVLKEVNDPAEQCFMLRRYQDLLRTGDIGNLQRQLDEDLLHVLSGTATQTTGAATGRSHSARFTRRSFSTSARIS